MIYLAFKLKNFNLIIDYLNRILKVLTIWDHKKFFLFLFDMISEQIFPLFKFLNVLGFRLMIRGKVGVGGNSRKRRVLLKLGKLTTTRYNPNVSNLSTWLNTTTGALGFQLVVLYSN